MLKESTHLSTTANDTEMAVVCTLLIEKDAWAKVIGWLTPEMFKTSELAFVYEGITRLCERGETPDVITVSNELQKTDAKRFDEIGGIACLYNGLYKARHAGNLTAYAEEVKRLFLLRRLKDLLAVSQGKAAQTESDFLEVVSETERALLGLREVQQKGKPTILPVAEVATQTIAYHRNRIESNGNDGQVLTGITEFDTLTGGMHAGELYVLGGRPGDGKSAVAQQIALNAALEGKQTCIFSMEMTPLQTMNRYFVGHAGIDSRRLRTSELTGSELSRMEQLRDSWNALPLYFDYRVANSAEHIRAQVLLHQKRYGCDLVVVDYLHLMESKAGRNEIQEHVVGRNVSAMKNLSLEAGCPVLLISQMNRNSENRSDRLHLPQLSDLRDSGTIEQVADCVFFVYRPERYGITEDEKTGKSLEGIAKLIISKNRNGQTGIACFRHNTTFTNLTNDPWTSNK